MPYSARQWYQQPTHNTEAIDQHLYPFGGQSFANKQSALLQKGHCCSKPADLISIENFQTNLFFLQVNVAKRSA